MPKERMPRKLLAGSVEHARPVGCPQMTWGLTLNKELKSYDHPTNFGQWSTLAADRRVRQQRIGIRAPLPASSNVFDTRQMARAFRRPHKMPLTILLKIKYLIPTLTPGISEI